RAKLLYLNYPNNPTGAVVPEGFFERVVEFAAEHELLVVHDNAYSETCYDGYRAPSFLATPGAKEVGVEVFSLSKGYNMTGWRCAAVVGSVLRARAGAGRRCCLPGWRLRAQRRGVLPHLPHDARRPAGGRR